MVALLKNVLTFATIFVLEKKAKNMDTIHLIKCPGGPIMPLIAIIMTKVHLFGASSHMRQCRA